MFRIKFIGILTLQLLLMLTACARFVEDDRYLQNRPDVYLEAIEEPQLQIPPNLSDEYISHSYDIREVPGEPGGVSIIPPI